MKFYDSYLFDADGTLLDSAEMIYQCFVHTCRQWAGLDVTRKQVFSHIGIPLRPQLELLLGPLSDKKAQKVMDIHMAYQESIFNDYLQLFPEVFETLQELKRMNKKLAVVTSRRLYSLTVYLKHTNIFHFFDTLITQESTLQHKPDPQPALEAARQLQCPPSECIFIGDALFDIQCGNAAGMDTAFVSWSQIRITDFTEKPTYTIHSLSDLLVSGV